MGLEEVLLLTCERNAVANYEYVRDCVAQTASHFHSVTVEVFPMSEEEYHGLAAAGCTGMTLYQETYEPVQYERLHLWGPKRDYAWRLDAPARALAGGIRTTGLGALLGLSDPFLDILCLYRHASYLRQRFWKGGVSISFPRVRPQTGGYAPDFFMDEKFLAQIIFAFRICLPDVPLTLSTRESPRFRDGMAGVGFRR
jgi:2-iminoacetate synthase